MKVIRLGKVDLFKCPYTGEEIELDDDVNETAVSLVAVYLDSDFPEAAVSKDAQFEALFAEYIKDFAAVDEIQGNIRKCFEGFQFEAYMVYEAELNHRYSPYSCRWFVLKTPDKSN